MATHDIAKYNENVDDRCSCCNAAKSTANHIRWQCAYFDEARRKHDTELATVPLKYLLTCIQCGIAPAMEIDGDKSYWGADSVDTMDEKTKVMLGKDVGLHTGGQHIEESQAR